MASSRPLIYWDQEEIRRLFATLEGPRDRALFPLAYHHGLRVTRSPFRTALLSTRA